MYERVDEDGAPVVPDPAAPDRPDRYKQVRGSDGRVIATMDFGNAGPRADDGIALAHDPGPGWRRLLWRDWAARTGRAMVQPGRWPELGGALPGLRRGGIWNGYLQPPDEGSLDHGSWMRLTDLLRRHAPAGDDTICTASHLQWTSRLIPQGAQDIPYVFRGRLGDVDALPAHPDYRGTPRNLWPDDRTWAIYTSYDFWATRVSGPTDLIEQLLADPLLEVDRLPDTPHPPAR